MSAALEKRLLKLEGPINRALVVDALDEYGYEELAALLSTLSFGSDGAHITVARFLTLDLANDVLALEDFRGKVPDEVLRQAYSICRNWAMQPEQLGKVRLRAGVVDGNMKVMPGYRLAENGCIVEA